MRRITLTQYLVEQQREKGIVSAELRLLIEVVARACKSISNAISKGALSGNLGGAGTDNVQGEAQKKLDVISNEVLLQLRLMEAGSLIEEINLGATAIGTGINSHPAYAPMVCKHLVALSGVPVKTAENLVEATQDCGAFVQMSGVLKRIAVKLSKTCNDLRLLSSGPRAGFGEIQLPAVQAGSSIMPGKINPVIPEVVNQIAFEVIGNDVTVTMAAEGGQLQLNAFEPIIAYSLFRSVPHLRQGCIVLARQCVVGITANRDRLAHMVAHTIGIVTALNPYLGYERTSTLAKEAHATGRGVVELVLEKGWLSKADLDRILSPENLTEPRPPVRS